MFETSMMIQYKGEVVNVKFAVLEKLYKTEEKEIIIKGVYSWDDERKVLTAEEYEDIEKIILDS